MTMVDVEEMFIAFGWSFNEYLEFCRTLDASKSDQ